MQLSGMETASYKIERPDYNSREGYMIVPRSADEPREPLGAPAPEGGHGHYDVVFTLSVPGKDVFTTDLVLGQAVSRGDSLVAFPETISSYEVYLKGNGEDIGSIVLLKNSAGRLCAATLDVLASSFLEAEKLAYERTTSLLSFLTFTCDVGIEIAGYEITERETKSVNGVRGMVGKIKPFSLPAEYERFTSNETARRLLAAYREAMNSTNVFYQALSYSKVIEGMTPLLAGDRTRKALKFPDDIAAFPVPADVFRRFLGKKFNSARDYFRPVIRNAIAHLDPSKAVLDIDHFDDVKTCEEAIPVLRYMGRALISDYFKLSSVS
jgi:hypothetical protein